MKLLLSKYLLLTLIVFCTLQTGCEDIDSSPNTNKYTYYDDISDITYLNSSFYTTNYDLSGNAGEQIDLIVYDIVDTETVMNNKFSLGLNGQGYLSITNDGNDLFLQSRSNYNIFKISNTGEIAYLSSDTLDTKWLPSGLTYNSSNDSLVFLYRNTEKNNQYRLREVSKLLSEQSKNDREFVLNGLDTTVYGALCIAYKEPNLYVLAFDGQEDVLITMDYSSLNLISNESVNDSTAVGIDIANNSIYLSYRDRTISLFKEL